MKPEHIKLVEEIFEVKFRPHFSNEGGMFFDERGYQWDGDYFGKLIAAIDADKNAEIAALNQAVKALGEQSAFDAEIIESLKSENDALKKQIDEARAELDKLKQVKEGKE